MIVVLLFYLSYFISFENLYIIRTTWHVHDIHITPSVPKGHQKVIS